MEYQLFLVILFDANAIWICATFKKSNQHIGVQHIREKKQFSDSSSS